MVALPMLITSHTQDGDMVKHCMCGADTLAILKELHRRSKFIAVSVRNVAKIYVDNGYRKF